MLKLKNPIILIQVLFITALAGFGNPIELQQGVFYQSDAEQAQGNIGWIEFRNFTLVIDPQWTTPQFIRDTFLENKNKTLYLFSTQSPAEWLQNPSAGWQEVLEQDGVFLIRQEINQNLVDLQTDLEKPVSNIGTQLTFEREMILEDGERAVKLIRYGHGQTPDDAVVFMPKEGILFGGALVPNETRHSLSRANTESWITRLEALQYLEPGTVIPRFGEAGGAELLERQQRYIAALRQTVEQGLDEGLSKESILENTQIDFDAWQASGKHLEEVYKEITGLKTPWTLRQVKLWAGPSFSKETPGWTPPKKMLVRGLDGESIQELKRVAPNIEFISVRNYSSAPEALAEADAVLGYIGKDELQAAKNLRWVHSTSAGVSGYLYPEFVESDVVLTNGQGVMGPSIADHVMGLTLLLSKGLNKMHRNQWDARWQRGLEVTEGHITLHNKTMLVLGLGGIGREVARRAHGFNMQVLAVDPQKMDLPPFVDKIFPPEKMKSLLPKADVVAVCVPLTKQTYQYINRESFELMKPSAIIINVARGKVIEQDHLVEALREGKIGGAALDVTDPEPLPDNHPLWTMDNVIITPHVAARTHASSVRRWHLLRENVRRFANGEALLNVVDKVKGY